jgi:putative transposase
MFVVAEHFLSDVVDDYGSHQVSTDGDSWYPHQTCRFLKIKTTTSTLHSKKALLKGNAILKYRTKECFEDDYLPCRKM